MHLQLLTTNEQLPGPFISLCRAVQAVRVMHDKRALVLYAGLKEGTCCALELAGIAPTLLAPEEQGMPALTNSATGT
jgi:hypothetical protein